MQTTRPPVFKIQCSLVHAAGNWYLVPPLARRECWFMCMSYVTYQHHQMECGSLRQKCHYLFHNLFVKKQWVWSDQMIMSGFPSTKDP